MHALKKEINGILQSHVAIQLTLYVKHPRQKHMYVTVKRTNTVMMQKQNPSFCH